MMDDDGTCYVTLPYLLGKTWFNCRCSWQQSAHDIGISFICEEVVWRAQRDLAEPRHSAQGSATLGKNPGALFGSLLEIWHCQAFRECLLKGSTLTMYDRVYFLVAIFMSRWKTSAWMFMIFRQESKSEATLAWSSKWLFGIARK